MSDDKVLRKIETLQQQMQLGFQLVREDMKSFRESVDERFANTNATIRELRLTTLTGLVSIDRRLEILRGRLDRIERHLQS